LSAHHHYPLTELVLVGPDLAKEWLEGSAPNRALSLRAVDRYADDMRAGRSRAGLVGAAKPAAAEAAPPSG
jgi:hypothetical protein